MEIYTIYGITDCPACLRAKADLMEHDIEHIFVHTDESPTFRTRIKDRWVRKTLPIIIKSDLEGDNLIGGYIELSNLLGFIDPPP